VSNAIESARRIAFQGEPGAYANLAAREAVPQAQAVPKPTFEDAIEAVRSGETDLVIIPVENSLIGRIADIHHLLPQSGLHIVAEHFLPIRHQLLGLKDANLEDITSVYSQAPALAQCRSIIRERKLVAHHWYDTAGSAKHVAELGDKSVAAIASSLAAEFYGLKILKPDVEDELSPDPGQSRQGTAPGLGRGRKRHRRGLDQRAPGADLGPADFLPDGPL